MPGYRLNKPAVISEIIDGEAVVIHLGTGTYYSLRGTAAVVWDALGQGASSERIVEALHDASIAEEGESVWDAVTDFVGRLVEEDLVVSEGEGDSLTPLRLPAIDQPFEAPALERYSDMQDLILLDPVHDVDAQVGWPRAK